MGLLAPQHVGSSQTRSLTHVSWIGRWILNHWTTKEAPSLPSLVRLGSFWMSVPRPPSLAGVQMIPLLWGSYVCSHGDPRGCAPDMEWSGSSSFHNPLPSSHHMSYSWPFCACEVGDYTSPTRVFLFHFKSWTVALYLVWRHILPHILSQRWKHFHLTSQLQHFNNATHFYCNSVEYRKETQLDRIETRENQMAWCWVGRNQPKSCWLL